MNCQSLKRNRSNRSRKVGDLAFSLPEFIVTAGIFLMVVGGILSAHVFGLRMIQFVELSSQISQSDRLLLQRIGEEMATAKAFDLGSGSASGFSDLAANRLQIANALQIYPALSTTQYVRYYLSTRLDTLYRVTSESSTAEVVADSIINGQIFSAEDGRGNTLSNQTQGAVLSLNILFQDAPKQTWGINKKALTHRLKAKFRVRATD